MIYESDKHCRRTPRLKGYDYSSDGAYFVTICTYNRECTLGDIINDEMHLKEYGNIVRDEWHNLPKRYLNIGLDAIVVMPNHIHAIIVLHDVGAIHELPLRWINLNAHPGLIEIAPSGQTSTQQKQRMHCS